LQDGIVALSPPSPVKGNDQVVSLNKLLHYNPVSAVILPNWGEEKRQPVLLTPKKILDILNEAKQKAYFTLYIPIPKASVWTGHTDTQMVDQIYTHI